MSHDRNAEAADITHLPTDVQPDVQRPGVQRPDVQRPDVSVEVRLAQLLQNVQTDARSQPDAYARDTEVPDGGE